MSDRSDPWGQEGLADLRAPETLAPSVRLGLSDLLDQWGLLKVLSALYFQQGRWGLLHLDCR